MSSDAGLPFSPPIEPMLARLREELPEDEGWRYEPKWDGFRLIVFKDGDYIYLTGRGDKPLARYFPEVEQMLVEKLPARCIVDGEIFVASERGLEFDALSQRIHPAVSRIRRLAEETPAAVALFDVLADGEVDLRDAPEAERRARLEALFGPGEDPGETIRPGTHLSVTAQTDDPELARSWLDRYDGLGLDGLIAKRIDEPYSPGKRAMVKFKRQRTADCVVAAYRLHKHGGVGSLLLGLYDDAGVLHHVGHTASFKADERTALLKRLRPYEGGAGFGGRGPGGPSRWRAAPLEHVPLEPVLVCEVAYDRMISGRFRHATRFVRWREDRNSTSCRFDQTPN